MGMGRRVVARVSRGADIRGRPRGCLRRGRAGLSPVSMPLFLRVYPGGPQYRLPDSEDAGEVTRSLAEVLGERRCVALGHELPDQPRSTAVVLINANVVQCVELVDVPQEPRPG